MQSNQPCPICDRQKNTRPIFENDDWLVRHSAETNIVGYVLIEAKRHFLDMADATESECASYGEILQRVTKGIRRLVPAERVYTFTLGEVVPHFHVHVIPRTNQLPRGYRGRGILTYPLEPKADNSLVDIFSDGMAKALSKR
ncbi:MAG: HIT family protein [Cyanobacteria bacterium SZAS-4]|nr:HIT family protein [Cyanobacteria bacterium SZAS-4]